MSTIREKIAFAALSRSHSLIDFSIYDNFHKQHEFRLQTVLADESLTEDEK